MGNAYSEYKKRKDEEYMTKFQERWNKFLNGLSNSDQDILFDNMTINGRVVIGNAIYNNIPGNLYNVKCILQFLQALNLKKKEIVLLEKVPYYKVKPFPYNYSTEESISYYTINLSVPSRNIINKDYVMKY